MADTTSTDVAVAVLAEVVAGFEVSFSCGGAVVSYGALLPPCTLAIGHLTAATIILAGTIAAYGDCEGYWEWHWSG